MARAQGYLVATCFAMLLAGTNAMTPLLPLYRTELLFSPLMLTLTFTCYVSVQVGTLLVLSRPGYARHAPVLICTALALAIVADLSIATSHPALILVGRALAGVSAGIGTGAGSALVVAALGHRGRSVTVSGNLCGAVVGTSASQVLVHWLGAGAMQWSYAVHAACCAAALAGLVPVLIARRDSNRRATVMPMGAHRLGIAALPRRPLIVGVVAWIAVSAVIVLIPNLSDEAAMPTVQRFGVILFLLACAVAQIGAAHLQAGMPRVNGLTLCAAGMGVAVMAIWLGSEIFALCGLVMIGLGGSTIYRLALIELVMNEGTARQGAIASFYAALTYGAAAAFVLSAGLLGNLIGLGPAYFVALAILCPACLAAAFIAPSIRRDSLPG